MASCENAREQTVVDVSNRLRDCLIFILGNVDDAARHALARRDDVSLLGFEEPISEDIDGADVIVEARVGF